MGFSDRDWDESMAEERGLDGVKLDEAMGVLTSITGEQGVSQCVVVCDGSIVWQGSDIDNLHSVWSCTKSFLSMVLGLLIDDGRCTLDTLAVDIYPAMAEHYPKVTLRHLVTFSSGYKAGEVSSTVGPFEPVEPDFVAGEAFAYSWDPYVLALILTIVAGESLSDLFRRRIAEPLGLDSSSWKWGDWGAVDHLTGLVGVPVCGGSGLYEKGVSITARALARVGGLLASEGQCNGEQLLSRQFIDQATRPQVLASVPSYDPKAWYVRLPGRYGYYWWVNGVDCEGRRLWPSAPAGTFAMVGNQDNCCFVIPRWRMVVVRLGTDGQLTNDYYDEFFAALRSAFVNV